MSPLLELFSGILILVNSSQYGHDFLLRRKRDRAGNLSARLLGCLDNLRSRLVEKRMVVSLQFDSVIRSLLFLLILLYCFRYARTGDPVS